MLVDYLSLNQSGDSKLRAASGDAAVPQGGEYPQLRQTAE